MSATLTREEAEQYLPEKIKSIALKLLDMGFSLKYRHGTGERTFGANPPLVRSRLTARKNQVTLKVVAVWLKPGKEPQQVRLYQLESIGGHPPGLSYKGKSTFWNAAENA